MGVKRKRKGTNGHSSKAPNKGEGTFSLAFELPIWFFHFSNLVKAQIWPYKELAKSPF
jgi:hypothetical protein